MMRWSRAYSHPSTATAMAALMKVSESILQCALVCQRIAHLDIVVLYCSPQLSTCHMGLG